MIQGWANSLRVKTEKGAALFFDGELYEKPEWEINRWRVTFTSGNVTIWLWQSGDDAKEAEKDLRNRIRVLVDA